MKPQKPEFSDALGRKKGKSKECPGCGHDHSKGPDFINAGDRFLLGGFEREVDAIADRISETSLGTTDKDRENVQISFILTLAARLQLRAAKMALTKVEGQIPDAPKEEKYGMAFGMVDEDCTGRLQAMAMCLFNDGKVLYGDEVADPSVTFH